MLDVMFELPSREDIEKCIITKDTVLNNNGTPTLVYRDGTVTEGIEKHPKESA